MSRVAVATCAVNDIDPDSPVLLAALDRAGVEARLCAWDDPAVAWGDYDLVVVRSTWDYPERRGDFLRWARGLARVENPYPVLEYSSDKHYLADLASRGVRVVASTFVEVGEATTWPVGDFVVKPSVGAGSRDAERYRPDQVELAAAHVARLHALGRDALVQPYVHSVDEVGERALVFIDGSFSHALTKGAMLNVVADDRDALFRRERMTLCTPEPEALAFAAAALDAVQWTELLYARVDLVRDDWGWALMELELVEPSLFLVHHPPAAVSLAQGIARRAA